MLHCTCDFGFLRCLNPSTTVFSLLICVSRLFCSFSIYVLRLHIRYSYFYFIEFRSINILSSSDFKFLNSAYFESKSFCIFFIFKSFERIRPSSVVIVLRSDLTRLDSSSFFGVCVQLPYFDSITSFFSSECALRSSNDSYSLRRVDIATELLTLTLSLIIC